MGKKAKMAIGSHRDCRASAPCSRMSAAKRGNKAVEVRIEPVQKRDLIASVTASGQVRPQTKVDVASDVSGKIIKLSVKEGQMVTAGQFLLQIDPDAGRKRPSSAPKRRSRRAARSSRRRRPTSTRPRRATIGRPRSRRPNPQLISDEQLEQLRTAVDVNKALVEAAQARRRSGDRVAQRRQELARQDDDLRADVGPGDAARRRAG